MAQTKTKQSKCRGNSIFYWSHVCTVFIFYKCIVYFKIYQVLNIVTILKTINPQLIKIFRCDLKPSVINIYLPFMHGKF